METGGEVKSDRVKFIVQIDPVLRDYVWAAAKRAGISTSEWVAQALQAAVANQSAAAAVRRALLLLPPGEQ